MTTKEFLAKANTSRSSLIRLTKDLMKKKAEWKITYIKETAKGNLFHHSLLSQFIPEWCLNKLVEYEEHFDDMRNLVAVLEDSNSLPYILYKMKWDSFITVAYAKTYKPERCFIMMSEVANILEEKCGKGIEFRMFFTTESFSHREGHHNHFFLRVGNHERREYALDFIKDYFAGDRVDIKSYDQEKAGLFYIAKSGLQGTEWDIRGNNLGNAQTK
ncbi:MAG: hypothetical protein ACO3E1_00265 [Flavobacteriales bacterium]